MILAAGRAVGAAGATTGTAATVGGATGVGGAGVGALSAVCAAGVGEGDGWAIRIGAPRPSNGRRINTMGMMGPGPPPPGGGGGGGTGEKAVAPSASGMTASLNPPPCNLHLFLGGLCRHTKWGRY